MTAPTADAAAVTTWRSGVTQFSLLFGFWLLLSGQYRPLFLVLGALSAAAVTLITRPIIATILLEPGAGASGRIMRTIWFVEFLLWLLWRILVASIQIARFALDPTLPFEPRFVRFHTTMKRPLSRVFLAVTITIVPGTITVRLDGDEYLVHCALPASADEFADARMQNFIGRFFGEEPEPPPELEWLPVEEVEP